MFNDVVFTGYGIISPFGNCMDKLCKKVDNCLVNSGACGLHCLENNHGIEGFDFSCKYILEHFPRLDISCKYLIEAVKQAMEKAKLDKGFINAGNNHRVAVIIGSSNALSLSQRRYLKALVKTGKPISLLFKMTANNLLSGIIAWQYGLHGYNTTICGNGVSGISAINMAMRLIHNNKAEIAIVGAVDTTDILLKYETKKQKNQGVMSGNGFFGGSGVVIVESRRSAIDRGAMILGELLYSCVGRDIGCDDLLAEYENIFHTYPLVDTCINTGDICKSGILKEMNNMGNYDKNIINLSCLPDECATTGFLGLFYGMYLKSNCVHIFQNNKDGDRGCLIYSMS